MMDALSVITEATKGIIDDLASHYELSQRRIYEMVGDQCFYPKVKRLIRAIGLFNKDGVRLIKADLDAMFTEILGECQKPVSDLEMHKELSEAIQAKLANLPPADRLKEMREAVAVLEREITIVEYMGTH